ncbi:MAG: glycosyl transferase, partial [Chloroflexi bacterium]|nr:glycosyl transferase [Chloroflexota bacterium]
REIVFMLGQGKDRDEARTLVEKYRQPRAAQFALEAVKAQWDGLLGAVQVHTPDDAMNVMLNGWLLYQVLACRLWGRSALYQSGGAFGFRDQLQDVLALMHADPRLTREQILRAAAHQFSEGDVQHWWHPPTGAGVRTRFSDDYLWLPYVADQYITSTGDEPILDESVEFIQAPPLEANQNEAYGQPQASGDKVSLYEHCTRAIDHALTRFGAHGLPLMGIGDWNDGMNRVGSGGKGESVWVGWFLYSILVAFAERAAARHDDAHADGYRTRADELKRALHEHAWDGAWYRRAFFDDGTPLGSAQNEECKIDSIVQSWAIISGAGDEQRNRVAMQSLDESLIDEQTQVVRLLAPPFDQGALDPGYIKGYLPGIRENGAQYTHAATWVILAYALMGKGERAAQLWHMLNPINHASTPDEAARYQVEPYVLAADVYTHPQHVGRGGWTWYTGSASWFYRIGLEHLLGVRRQGDALRVEPCIPRAWREYRVSYRFGASTYEITVQNPEGVNRGVADVEVDGAQVEAITLRNDGAVHRVRVVLGEAKD